MRNFLGLMLVAFASSKEECCKSKLVGGDTYTLLGEEDTSSFSCIDKCTYAKEGQANTKYCFAPGDMMPECKDSGSVTAGGAEPTTGPGGNAGTTAGAGGEQMSSPVAGGATADGGEAGTSPAAVGAETSPGAEQSGTTAGAAGATTKAAGGATTGSGCKCGVKKTSRIVGGTETEVNEYPWMSAISDANENQYCGGTLIGSQWVLSAAHCFFDQQGKNPTQAGAVRIVLGEHNLVTQDESKIPKKVVSVSKIITHPSYNSSTSNNDIALLKLSEEVDLNVYTPACLAKTGDTFAGKNAWVYGWGTTSSGGASSDKLLEVEIPVVTNAVCSTAMAVQGVTITDAMLCAGGQANKDGCQGDSGGPLTVDVGGQHVLIGDVSFGIGCGGDGLYGVYGNVANLRSWVDSTVAANGDIKICPA